MAVHLFGGTGVGKTTAQYAAMSIWGDPELLSLQKSDTHNSRMNRGEVMHSLPLISDEMTNVTSSEMSEYVYQVSGVVRRTGYQQTVTKNVYVASRGNY